MVDDPLKKGSISRAGIETVLQSYNPRGEDCQVVEDDKGTFKPIEPPRHVESPTLAEAIFNKAGQNRLGAIKALTRLEKLHGRLYAEPSGHAGETKDGDAGSTGFLGDLGDQIDATAQVLERLHQELDQIEKLV